MMIFLKGNEKKEREERKAAEKAALDKTRKEDVKLPLGQLSLLWSGLLSQVWSS